MPTYVYKCRTCEQQFEVQQSFNDPPLAVCPTGDGGEVRKVFLPVGITFKGSGFYKTDSRSGSSSSRSAGGANGSSGETSGGSTGSGGTGSSSGDSTSGSGTSGSGSSGSGSTGTPAAATPSPASAAS